MTTTILICDDDVTVRASMTLVLKRAGFEVAAVASPDETITYIRTHTPQLLLMDMNFSKTTTGEEGLELLAKVKLLLPKVPVILITAWGSIELAVRGIKGGAFDFVTKPWNNVALLHIIRTALELNEESNRQQPPGGQTIKRLKRDRIIGESSLLKQLLETVSRIAPTNAPVLITGESGTGKELIAEAIHENSSRASMPFVKVNLGGISQSLFESEMFGHRKGAFTDAHHDRVGRFELANKGSIFLDEIGELELVSQVKLLRVLQDQTFEPLGDSRSRQVDTRVICATNRHLPQLVNQGAFREDLFYRINLITIQMPALRERKEDIPLLADFFIRKQVEENGLRPTELTADAVAFLQQLSFPGNIRELKNLIERTLLVSGKQQITDKELKEQYVETPLPAHSPVDSLESLEQVEREMILKTIRLYGGNHSKVATALGMSRQSLYRRMEKYNIKPIN